LRQRKEVRDVNNETKQSRKTDKENVMKQLMIAGVAIIWLLFGISMTDTLLGPTPSGVAWKPMGDALLPLAQYLFPDPMVIGMAAGPILVVVALIKMAPHMPISKQKPSTGGITAGGLILGSLLLSSLSHHHDDQGNCGDNGGDNGGGDSIS
jgi:hypothetical protein